MPSARTKDHAKIRQPRLVHGTSVLTAFQQLRELIVHGKLSPGTWIVEGDLAKRLHVSRTPVRAALNKLQQEGYVREHRMANKSRMIVAPLTKEDAAELYSVIGRLEGVAGRSIAALPKAERMKIVLQLKALNQKLADVRGGPLQAGQHLRYRPRLSPARRLPLRPAFGRMAQGHRAAGRALLAALCQLDHQRSPAFHRGTQRDHSGLGGRRSRSHRAMPADQLGQRLQTPRTRHRCLWRTRKLVIGFH